MFPPGKTVLPSSSSVPPPSVLPDISPTRGEIRHHSGLRQSQTSQEGAEGETANLPTRGGDVRQDRGGRRRALLLTARISHTFEHDFQFSYCKTIVSR